MRLFARLSLFAGLMGGLHAQAIKTGPSVGERVPDFSAPDQMNRTQTLKSIVGPKGAMLVFFRSADW